MTWPPATTTVAEIYAQVCYALLENAVLRLGVVTEAQFLNALSVVLLDFSQKTSLDKTIFTEMVVAGEREYVIPEDVMKAELCFIGGKLIEKVTEADLTHGHFAWRRQWGVPRQWHEDNVDVKRMEIFPLPDYNGANIPGTSPPYGKYGDFYPSERNLTIVGSAAPSQLTWTLIDSLPDIPPSFSQYLVYGILAEIFSGESEARDMQRAFYCRTRYEEGIALADAILHEDLLEEGEED